MSEEPERHEISFVYFNAALNGIACILFVFFFLYAYNERAKIFRAHDTISSFCASYNSWGSRFLLSFTCIVGVNMLCLHVEEYNSRPEEFEILFWFEIAFIFPLPLVGLCYTAGKPYDEREEILQEFLIDHEKNENDDNNKSQYNSMSISLRSYEYETINKEVDCGFFKFPISISEKIHDISATIFFAGLTFTNNVYTFVLITDQQKLDENRLTIIMLFVLSFMNLISLLIYTVINKIIIGFCKKENSKLRTSSFILECLCGALVILSATLNSMKRNARITWM